MKRILALAAFILLASTHVWAQTISVAEAKTKPVGTVVTVAGVAMNGGELGPIRYIDDGTGGLALYFDPRGPLSATPILKGDNEIATGVVFFFNNLYELSPVSSFTVLARNRPVHPPIEFNAPNFTNAYSEIYEGRLVKLNKVIGIKNTGGGTITTLAGGNYTANNNTALIFRINSLSTGVSGAVGKPAPTDTFSLVGVMSQFSPSSPTGGYQILPRLFDDFVGAPQPLPNITSLISLLDASTTTISAFFTTQFEGSTKIEYGTSPTNLDKTFEDTTKITSHSFVLEGLKAGTIYYLRAKSTNPYGTSTAQVVPFVTQSNSTGEIKTYFTRSIREADASPGNTATHLLGLVDDTLIAYINRAKESLDISIYNWNNTNLSDMTAAVNDAFARGVKVRVLADGSTANLGLGTLSPGIRVLKSPQGTAPGGGFYTIMHNKFVIIDAEAVNPNQPIVWTGSTNWTSAQMTTDYNNVVTIQDQGLARVYKVEFEEMWGSDSLRPGIVFNGTTGTARFGPTKSDNTPHYIKTKSGIVECFFSPSDAVASKIVGFIGSANSSLQAAVFSWTRTDAANALRDKVNIWGPQACSRMLTEDTSGSGTGLVFRTVASAMQTGAQIFRPSGIFHHKYIIADQAEPSIDPKVLTGSHNWSTAADTRNDENTLIIHNRKTANQYYQEFSARWEQNGSTSCLATATAPALATRILIAPVPATTQITVSAPRLQGHTIRIFNIDGKQVLTKQAKGDVEEVGVETLAPGAYVLRIDGVAVPARFVKQ